jgi:hypothetical protein
VGQEAVCAVTFGKHRAEGKALLETSELIFRSPEFRLKIPFSGIKKLRARDGDLHVTYADGTAIVHMGKPAATWAEKIANPKSLVDKLGIKPEHRVCALKIRDDAFLADLKGRVPTVSTRVLSDADVILYGAENIDDLSRLRDLRAKIKPNGMIWTVTPKGKGGIKDTDVMAAGKAAGLVDVKVAAFSATHSAAKFVIPKAQR